MSIKPLLSVWQSLNFNIIPQYIKGGKSYIFCFLVTLLSLIIGCFTPGFLQIIKLGNNLDSYADTLLSTYVGVLSFAIAVSAIILAILQIANRKIQIAELVFTHTLFAPTFYFGVINIALLVFFQLFQYENSLFDSKSLFEKFLITETYLFVAFAILILVLLVKVLSLLNFSRLTDLYIEDVLNLVRNQKAQKQEKKDLQKIGLKRMEIYQEVEEAISKKDELIIEKFLDSFEQAMKIDKSSPLLFTLNLQLEDWMIASNSFQLVKNKFTVFWRRITLLQSKESPVNQFPLKFTPARVYRTLRIKRTNNDYAESFSIRLKEMIVYEVIYPLRGNMAELKEREIQIQNLLNCFGLLIREIAIHGDEQNLRHTLNHLASIIRYPSLLYPDTEFQNEDEPAVQSEPPDDTRIEMFRVDLENKVRSIPMAIYFYLLYKVDFNKSENINRDILSILRQEAFGGESPIPLILHFWGKTGIHSEWDEWLWNVEERLDGVVYTIPTVNDLLAFGFVLNMLITQNINENIPDNIYGSEFFTYLIHHSEEKLMELDREFWVGKLGIENQDFDNRFQQIRTFLSEVRSRNKIAEMTMIANTHLSEEKVQSFIVCVLEEWEKYRKIDAIFSYFDSLEINPKNKLVNLHPHVFAQGLKQMFLSSAPISVDGLDFGKKMVSEKERLLGQRIFEAGLPTKKISNIADGLNEAISYLSQHKYNPTVIFSFSNYLYPEEGTLVNSGKYAPWNKENAASFPFLFLGLYNKTIPIIKVYSNILKNIIVVTDLKNGIRLQQRENKDWIEEKLQIKVKEIIQEEVQDIFNKRKHQFGNDLTEEVRLEILNAILIEIDEICDFKILDKNALYAFEWTGARRY